MLFISKAGLVDAERIEVKIFPEIERGPMDKANGIVIHQTGGSSAESAFSSYRKKGANGAHFLINKDGEVYQAASLFKVTNHVGLLRSRCFETHKCSPVELKKVSNMQGKYKTLTRYEVAKKVPDRYPWNTDSIGIELVGAAPGEKGKEVFETVTGFQNTSLRWLIRELSETFNVGMMEIYRHPEISYKTKTEASTAKWE